MKDLMNKIIVIGENHANLPFVIFVGLVIFTVLIVVLIKKR